MIQIGSRVRLRNTGNRSVGVVTGLMEARTYLKGKEGFEFKLWDILYPDWIDHLVVFVEYDIPQQTSSYEDILKGLRKAEDDDFHVECVAKYVMKYNVKFDDCCVTPFADIIPLD